MPLAWKSQARFLSGNGDVGPIHGRGIMQKKIPVVGHHELGSPFVSTQKSIKIIGPIMHRSVQLIKVEKIAFGVGFHQIDGM